MARACNEVNPKVCEDFKILLLFLAESAFTFKTLNMQELKESHGLICIHGQILEIKIFKKIQIRSSRLDDESEYYSSSKNHESESEYSGFGGIRI